jgi:hypothetical protein
LHIHGRVVSGELELVEPAQLNANRPQGGCLGKGWRCPDERQEPTDADRENKPRERDVMIKSLQWRLS